MRTCAKCNHDCHEDAVRLRAALAAKDAEICPDCGKRVEVRG